MTSIPRCVRSCGTTPFTGAIAPFPSSTSGLADFPEAIRLGWAHEFADTSRPVTAAFAGAPGFGFTVLGAAPQRDSAVLGVGLNTAVAESTSIYVRYDGEVGGSSDNHVLSAGLRMTW